MADRLTLTRAFEGAGMESNHADRIATEIYDAIHDNVATKSDLRELEARVKADIAHQFFGKRDIRLYAAMAAQALVIIFGVTRLIH